MEDLLELALKKIDNLEKKLEKYFKILKVENELDFVMKGSYLKEEDIDNIMSGNY